MGWPNALNDIWRKPRQSSSDNGSRSLATAAHNARPQLHGRAVSIGRALDACTMAQRLLEAGPRGYGT
jgi:hypothetical protein